MDNNPFQNNENNQAANIPNQNNNQPFDTSTIQIPDDLKNIRVYGSTDSRFNGSRKSNPLIGIGISLLITSVVATAIYVIKGKSITDNPETMIPTLALLIFPLAGMSLGLNMYLNEKKSKERCSQSVIGKCIEISESVDYDSDGSQIMYTPTYSYQVNNQNYTITSSDSFNKLMKPQIGSNKQIFFNLNNPNDAIIPKSFAQIIIIAAISGSFVICGFGALIVSLIK